MQNNSSDRLGYDGCGRMITKRYLSSTLNGSNGYSNTTAVVGFTTAYDRASNKVYERHIHAEERSHLYLPIDTGGSVGFGYDSLDRLRQYQRGVLSSTGGIGGNGGGSITTPITLPGTDQTRNYTLDGLGNWKNTAYELVGSGGSTTATTEIRNHNDVNQITRINTNGTPQPFAYDHGNNTDGRKGNGNLSNDGLRSYIYDAFNRQIQVTRVSDSAVIAAYTYDGLGRRIRKVVTNGGITGTIPNGTSDYLYDDKQIIEERDGSNDPVRQMSWGIYVDELIQLTTYTTLGGGSLAAGAYYPLQDLLYRTTALTDSSGSIVEAYDTDAYGNTLIFSAAGTGGNWWADDATTSAIAACENIFTGRQYDFETGIYNYNARYYAQTLGRFLQRDPLRYVNGMNIYEYVGNNPGSRTDPTGMIWPYPPIQGPFPPSLPNIPSIGKIGGLVGKAVAVAEIIVGVVNWWKYTSADGVMQIHEAGPTSCPPGMFRYIQNILAVYMASDVDIYQYLFGVLIGWNHQHNMYQNDEWITYDCCCNTSKVIMTRNAHTVDSIPIHESDTFMGKTTLITGALEVEKVQQTWVCKK